MTDMEDFISTARRYCDEAVSTKDDADYSRNDRIANNICERLNDAVRGGEKDADKLTALAQKLADAAGAAWREAENETDDAWFVDNLLALVQERAEDGVIEGVGAAKGDFFKLTVTA